MSCKGNRSRRLPLTGDVTEVLAGCDRVSATRLGPSRRTFFVSATGNQVTAATVGKVFNSIWTRPVSRGPQAASSHARTTSGTTSPTPTSNDG